MTLLVQLPFGHCQLGVSTSYIGKIKNDKLGDFFRSDLEKSNIEPKLLYGDAETGTAITLISTDSERTFATYLGSAIELTAGDLTAGLFQDHDIITNQQVVALFNFKPRTGSKLCQDWVKEGFIEIVNPSRKRREYRLGKKYQVLIDA